MMTKQQNTKSADSLARKDNLPLEKCPGPSKVEIGVFRPRWTCWEEYFNFQSHMRQDIFQGPIFGEYKKQ